MSQVPKEIRADIEQTRADLGLNGDTTIDGVKDSVDSAVHRAGDALQGTPQTVTTKAQGNPLAAGLIAFGAGMLAASLIPASEKEKEAASALKEKAEPLVTEATAAAKQVASGLKDPLSDAVDSVKQKATDSAQAVKDEGAHAASNLQDQTRDAKETIQANGS